MLGTNSSILSTNEDAAARGKVLALLELEGVELLA